MVHSVVKVPFGPEVTLYRDEFFAVARHRFMIFFYFGIICLILVVNMGPLKPLAEPEIVIGLAAIEVMAGLCVVLLCKTLVTRRARRKGTVPRIRLSWILVATATTAVCTARALEPLLLDQPRDDALHFVLQLIFYITVTELLTSIMLQYSIGYILDDLRKPKTGAAGTPADKPTAKPLA